MSIERVLLTGAGGFSGSHALRHILTNTDWDVVCPVTFTHHGLADRIRLALDDIPSGRDRVHVIKHDLAAPVSSVTDHVIDRIDAVFNYASESHVDRSITHPGPFIRNNVSLMTNLLDWVWSRGDEVQIVVHVSTDEVYGPARGDDEHAEWVDLHMPSNPYAASKAAQEDIGFAYWRTYDLPFVMVNVMNVIGETQSAEKFIPMTIAKALSGEPMTIHASPEGVPGSRMYLHARNKADALLHLTKFLLHNPYNDDESLRYSYGSPRPFKFHVAGLEEVDNLAMAQMIAEAVGKPLNYELVSFHESRPGHDLRYALGSSKIAETGWKAPVAFEDSLRQTVRWTLDHREWLNT